ncbi:cytochrome P450 CYP684A2 [Aspergillus japonicus CBS 114.51]|uniref:Cytochrome P450 CYP684A2 n=2 Tax=Aspergillus TaxID=5052 RepID=A0A2V5HJE5_ASPV1|nr:cytochrome P450 CYP684A2 [Aspergillus japonicus CBS 114.51]PYI16250.1 cytochrome P450 CYP684A2 [Aspergillus violaceofuscus CBS 115571]RAH80536.1 cytochrome P450 CYP684A2 [Aspergillus japonicus CBS 114.51]
MLFIIGVVLGCLLVHFFYRGLTSPLAHIPGPPYSRWTSAVFSYYCVRGEVAQYVHGLHRKYGPVVRVTPTEVDICDTSAVKQIHKTGSAFLKSQWYVDLTPRERQSTFSTVDPKFHAAHRRLLSSPISDSALMTQFEPLIRARVSQAIDGLGRDMAATGAGDVYKWMLFMATDIIGEMSFGESFRMLDSGQKSQYSNDLERIALTGIIRTTFPTMFKLAATLPLPYFRETVKAVNRLESYAVASIGRYYGMLKQNPKDPKPTLFTKLYDAGENGLSEKEIIAEARTFIVAGSDTTAVTLTYLIHAVCQNPQIRDTLVAEVAQLPADFTDRDLRGLPYLNRVILESLRLYSAVPSALRRAVPAGGAHLAGYSLPAGVTVGTQSYSLHRDEKIFPDAERFEPDRWVSPTQAMKDASLPFGGGSRVCLGIHLARIELRLATAMFFRRFPQARVSSRYGMSEADMVMETFFLMAPKGHRCLIEGRDMQQKVQS